MKTAAATPRYTGRYPKQTFPFTFSVLVRQQLQFCVGFHEESFDMIGGCANKMVRHVVNMTNKEGLKGLNTSLIQKSQS